MRTSLVRCTTGVVGQTRLWRGTVLAALVLICSLAPAPASSAAPTSLAPCAPGSVIAPTVRFQDTAKGTARLTATHPIEARWSADNSDGVLLLDNYSVSPPFAMVPFDNSATFIPATPGIYPFGLAWEQEPLRGTANRCSGSLSRLISVGPATRPRFSPVRFSFGGRLAERITELSWTLNTSGPRLNLGLITAEFRAVARDRVPNARTPARTLRFALCDCDPLFGKIHNPGVVRVGPVQMVVSTEIGIRFLLDVKVSTTHVTRFGYDLLVRQGRFRLGRLQAAGTCRFSSGFSNCSVDHFSKPGK
jgi:hypothetical protein